MNVITLLNEKGGVGKTTLATHIAAGLAIKGYRVVLIDSDPQGNATSAVGLEKRPNFYDLTVRNDSWRDVLGTVHPDVYGEPHEAPKGQLLAVSGNKESRNIANMIGDNKHIRRQCHHKLEQRKMDHQSTSDRCPHGLLQRQGCCLC